MGDGDLSGSGLVRLNDAELGVSTNAAETVEHLTISHGVISGGADLAVSKVLTFQGAEFNGAVGAEIVVESVGVMIADAKETVFNGRSLKVDEGGSEIIKGRVALRNGANIENKGKINIEPDSVVTINSGSILNKANAAIDLKGEVLISYAGGKASIENSGKISVMIGNGNGTGPATITVPLDNIEGGRILVTSSLQCAILNQTKSDTDIALSDETCVLRVAQLTLSGGTITGNDGIVSIGSQDGVLPGHLIWRGDAVVNETVLIVEHGETGDIWHGDEGVGLAVGGAALESSLLRNHGTLTIRDKMVLTSSTFQNFQGAIVEIAGCKHSRQRFCYGGRRRQRGRDLRIQERRDRVLGLVLFQ